MSEQTAPTVGTFDYTVSVKVGEETKTFAVAGKEIAANVKDAMNRYGAEIVFDLFLAAAKQKLNGVIARCIKAGQDDAKIAEIVAGWKPGDSIALERAARDPLASVKKAASNMTPEEKLELAKSLGLIS